MDCGVALMDEVNTTCTVTADDSLSSASASVPWSPRQLVFRPYAPSDAKSQNLRVLVKRPVSSFFLPIKIKIFPSHCVSDDDYVN